MLSFDKTFDVNLKSLTVYSGQDISKSGAYTEEYNIAQLCTRNSTISDFLLKVRNSVKRSKGVHFHK